MSVPVVLASVWMQGLGVGSGVRDAETRADADAARELSERFLAALRSAAPGERLTLDGAPPPGSATQSPDKLRSC